MLYFLAFASKLSIRIFKCFGMSIWRRYRGFRKSWMILTVIRSDHATLGQTLSWRNRTHLHLNNAGSFYYSAFLHMFQMLRVDIHKQIFGTLIEAHSATVVDQIQTIFLRRFRGGLIVWGSQCVTRLLMKYNVHRSSFFKFQVPFTLLIGIRQCLGYTLTKFVRLLYPVQRKGFNFCTPLWVHLGLII